MAAAPGDAPVGGQIFVDFDRDGFIDAGELVPDSDSLFPPAGVTVTVFDDAGGSVAGVVTSSAAGVSWTADVTGLAGSEFRVEFGLDPADVAAGFSETFTGVDAEPSVTFAAAGDTDVSFGVTPPSQCPTSGTGFGGNTNSVDGKLWTTCYVNGDRDAAGAQDVLVGLNFDRSGAVEKIGLKGDEDDLTSAASELGAVWGIAYDEWRSTLYTSSVVRRHSDFGSEGLDGLYYITYPSGTWSSVSLQSLGAPSYGAALTRDLEGVAVNAPSYDVEAYSAVGTRGIGDIDVTPDGRTLLVSNLDNRSIDVFDISAAGGAPAYTRSIAISNPGCTDSANTDDYEIWALDAFDGDTAYVGVTCTARNSAAGVADLEAHMVEVDLAAGAEGPVALTIPLDYARTEIFRPWTDTYPAAGDYAQPIFSDIDISADGSLELGFIDRFAMQMGSNNRRPDPTMTDTNLSSANSNGELLHACNTGTPENPTWVLEGAAGSACDPFANGVWLTGTQSGDRRHFGPGGDAEWYGGERYLEAGGGTQGVFGDGQFGHAESALGGVYVHPYLGEVVAAVYDPFRVHSGGFSWFDVDDGAYVDGFELYAGRNNNNGAFGKAVGLGDVEGCAIPVGLGDFVWLDVDQDGVQDPGELALTGATITITGGSLSAPVVVTTDADGRWEVTSADGIIPGEAYTIAVDPTSVTNLPAGAAALLTATSQDSTDGTDVNDSDIDPTTLTMTTAALAVGEVNHTYDAGFFLPESVSVGDYVFIDGNGDGVQDGTDVPVEGATLTLTGPTGGAVTDIFGNVVGPITTDAAGLYSFDGLPVLAAGESYTVTIDPSTAPALAGHLPTQTGQGTSGTDSSTGSASSGDLTADGDRDDTLDFGFVPPAVSVGDYVFIDVNGDGVQDGTDVPVEGATLTLTGPTGAAVTDIYGNPVGPVTTDASGLYSFDDLPALAAGESYTVTIDPSTASALAGYVATQPGQGTGATDSSTGTASSGDLVNDGDADVTLDFGFVPASVSVGDYVFIDANGDGVQDATDVPVEGATLTLTGPTGGAVTDIFGNVVGPVTTDASGLYSFDDLPALPAGESYTVTIDPSTAPALAGYVPTLTGQGTTATDSSTGSASSGDLVNDGDRDDTLDFGFQPGFSLGNQVWLDVNNNGLIDGLETGIDGVTVELFADTDGNGVADDVDNDGEITSADAIGTTTTTSGGLYLFDGLAPGDYVVGVPPTQWNVDGPLDGLLSSDPTETDPDTDIDGDDNGTPGTGGYVWSGGVTLGDGEPTGEAPDNDLVTQDGNENLTVDFGFWEPVMDLALFIQLDDGTNNDQVGPGDTVTFTITVENQGDLDADSIDIVNYLPAGLTLADGDWTDNGDGTAGYMLPSALAAGASTTVGITFTVNADAPTSIENWAEIAAARAIDGNGDPTLMPNGRALADIDSVPDTENSDTFTSDDDVTGSGVGGGDEDDHDRVGLELRPVSTTGSPLAFTGSNIAALALVGLFLVMAGVIATGAGTRRREHPVR